MIVLGMAKSTAASNHVVVVEKPRLFVSLFLPANKHDRKAFTSESNHLDNMGNSAPSGPQSYPVPGTGKAGETAHYRSSWVQKNNKGELLQRSWVDVSTAHEAFLYVDFLLRRDVFLPQKASHSR